MPTDLDAFFPNRATLRRPLGVVVGGSLSQSLDVKLNVGEVGQGVPPGAAIEDVKVGKYVVIEGRTGRKFFSIVTDIALDANNPDLAKTPPDLDDPFTAEIYGSSIAFGRLKVAPMLVLEEQTAEPKPVKTIPAHFAPVYEATAEDIARIFPEGEQHFHIGAPLDMDALKVNLNLTRFVERSSGVFGKSGTGKSFVTRTILAGVIKAEAASCLIFDMHNDYGWEIKNEGGAPFKGLTQLFPAARVEAITLDPETSRHRKSNTRNMLQICLEEIEPEDVEMVAELLGLTETQKSALHYLYRNLGPTWIARLLDDDDPGVEQLEEAGKIQKGTLRAMQRKFDLFRPERLGFLSHTADDKVDYLFGLLNRGTSVVLEFGRYGDNLAAYVFVANFLTRRIHKKYVEQKNKAAGGQAPEPRQLMIVIEEAHKFLDPEIAKHTIFGNIARELRKYNVTLLLVDQRPSGIDEEVMSQIGTRVTCLLDNEADIKAVFSGVSGAAQLREVLARLDTKQQALILGHAVPMPVVVKTREYGQELYAALGWQDEAARKAKTKKDMSAIFGEE